MLNELQHNWSAQHPRAPRWRWRHTGENSSKGTGGHEVTNPTGRDRLPSNFYLPPKFVRASTPSNDATGGRESGVEQKGKPPTAQPRYR